MKHFLKKKIPADIKIIEISSIITLTVLEPKTLTEQFKDFTDRWTLLIEIAGAALVGGLGKFLYDKFKKPIQKKGDEEKV